MDAPCCDVFKLKDGRLQLFDCYPSGTVILTQLGVLGRTDAYAGPNELGGPAADAFYHDNWWIWDAERGIYAAVGMNGQCIFVHRPSRAVIAKLSTFPDALDLDRFELHHAGMAALCESLA